MPKRIIFAGPSIFGIAPHLLDGLELRPPAGKGDLLAAATEGATSIGLIDGTFEYGASVWHKEILFALDRGVDVFGAASMGALRAAECAAFGMVGIGAIYHEYAEGRRQADEDVAIVHGPAELGFPPLTEALVDLDATIDHLRAMELIGATSADRLSEAAGKLHFKQRTWDAVMATADLPAQDLPAQDLPAQDLRAILRTHAVSRKRDDALLLLSTMTTGRSAAMTPPRMIGGTFSDTLFFQELRREVANRRQQENRV